jgi:hypothetical protein
MRVDSAPVAAAVPGRIDVVERVYRTVTQAASADAIGVARGAVAVDVAEHRGGLAVRVAAPFPAPDLADATAVAATAPVLERARDVQAQLKDRLTHILGREITRVSLTITGAVVSAKRRVR